jgi:hypothetical protein
LDSVSNPFLNFGVAMTKNNKEFNWFGWDILKGTAHDDTHPDHTRLPKDAQRLRKPSKQPKFKTEEYVYFDFNNKEYKTREVKVDNPNYQKPKSNNKFYVMLFLLVVFLIIFL